MARVDPFKNFRFVLEIDGIQQGGFTDCSGLGSHLEAVEYREGGDPNTVRKLPGKITYPDITLKWGVTTSTELYDWHMAGINGSIERKNGSVVLQDDTGAEAVRWNFYNAWPNKWDGPTFSAKGNDIAIDTLAISCERVERAE